MPNYPIDYSALGRLSPDRIRNSQGHRDALEADLAAQPAGPSHVTRTVAIADGLAITVDDGRATRIEVTAPEPGRLRLTVTADGTDGVSVDLSLTAAGLLDEAIRAVAGSNIVSPIVGSR